MLIRFIIFITMEFINHLLLRDLILFTVIQHVFHFKNHSLSVAF